ncbi:MAG: rhomboid family intramembrane serine protease [Leptospiraceae bacterium]|nr:rhomboid family intramembrane serine protease [Leptospiraceae bacterium]MCP5501258.1 rhomboid family intramembrane serine protease [Leptospiraceae bacterium]
MGNYNYQVRFGPSITPAVKALIIINSAIFVIHFIAAGIFNFKFLRSGDPLMEYLALNPRELNPLFYYKLLTYAFLHGGIMHLLLNMFSLWMFGSELEIKYGSKNFVGAYLLSCLLGGILSLIVYNLNGSYYYVLGASGGIFGVLLMYALNWPDREVLFMMLFPIKIKYLIGIYMLIIMFSQAGEGGNIAHMAHLGGAIGGALFFFADRNYKINFNFSLSRYRQKRKMMKYQEEMYERQNAKERVDELLDKISKHGMKSLTRKERQFLKEASNEYYKD